MPTVADFLQNTLTLELVRPAGDAPAFGQLAAVLRTTAGFSPDTAFRFALVQSKLQPFEPKNANESSLRALVPAPEAPGATLGFTNGGDLPLNLAWIRDLGRPAPEDVARIHVPWPASGARPGWATLQFLARLLRETAMAFEASAAALQTFDLRSLVGESARREIIARDPDLAGFVPGPAIPSPPLFDRFARLSPPSSFDRTRIPDAVWWANVWSNTILDMLGRDLVLSAGWAHQEPAGDGLLLVATQEPPDRDHPRALDQVMALAEAIDLPAVQHAARRG